MEQQADLALYQFEFFVYDVYDDFLSHKHAQDVERHYKNLQNSSKSADTIESRKAMEENGSKVRNLKKQAKENKHQIHIELRIQDIYIC